MNYRDLWIALSIALMAGVLWLFNGFQKEFDVTTINIDAEPIKYAITRFPGYRFNVGILSPRADGRGGATYVGHVGSWPKSVEIEWTFEEDPKQVFKREISVAGSLRAGYGEQLELIIEFSKEGVRAYPRVQESFSKGLKYRYPDGWRPVD